MADKKKSQKKQRKGTDKNGVATVDLINSIPEARGQSVTIDGTEYDIDERGVMEDVSQEHADKLLQNKKVWAKKDPDQPFYVDRPVGSVALIDDQGRHHYVERGGTGKTLSGHPLLGDDSEKAKDLPYANDSHNSHIPFQPLQDDKLKMERGPQHARTLQNVEAEARGYLKKGNMAVVDNKDLESDEQKAIAQKELKTGEYNTDKYKDREKADTDSADAPHEDTLQSEDGSRDPTQPINDDTDEKDEHGKPKKAKSHGHKR